MREYKFIINVPYELNESLLTNISIPVVAHELSKDRVHIGYEKITAYQAGAINWKGLNKMAEELALKHFESFNNARAIGDLEVLPNGEIITNPIKK